MIDTDATIDARGRRSPDYMTDSTEPAPSPTGVDGSRPRTGGPLALTAVTLGLIIWPLAFNYGAYNEVHYDDVFSMVVASTILFVVTMVNPVYPPPWIWFVRLALAAPMGWLLTAAWLEGSTSAALDRPGFVVWMLFIVVVSVPVTLRLLVDMFMPELTATASRSDPTGQIVQLVKAVDVHPVVAPVELVPLPQLRSDIGLAGRGEEGHADRPTTSGWAKHDRPRWKYQPWSAPTRWFASPTGATASTPLRAPKPPRQHG
jgi:hypothetical protein